MLHSAEHEFLPAKNRKLHISTVTFFLGLAQFEIFFAFEYENDNLGFWYFYIYQQRKFHAKLSWARKKYITSGQGSTSLMFAVNPAKEQS